MTNRLASFVAASAALVVVLLPAGVSAADDDAAKAERKLFEGAWHTSELVVNGGQQSLRIELHNFSGDKWTHKFRDQVLAEGTFTLHPRKPYGVIDFEYTSPENQKGKHWQAIYRFDGDTLQWMGENGPPRAPAFSEEEYKKLPQAFESKPRDGQIRRTLKRIKDQ